MSTPLFVETVTAFAGLRNPVSSGLHLSGAVVAIIATAHLFKATRETPTKRWHLTTYGISLITLLCASATFHGYIGSWETISMLLRVDLCAIFLLIAGSNIAIAYLAYEPGPTRQIAVAASVGLALAGMVAQWIPGYVLLPFWFRASTYIMLGWLGALALPSIRRRCGYKGLALLFCGGLSYTLGPILDLMRWPRLVPGVFESHELSHVTVLFGAAFIHLFIVRFVLPEVRETPSRPPHLAARVAPLELELVAQTAASGRSTVP